MEDCQQGGDLWKLVKGGANNIIFTARSVSAGTPEMHQLNEAGNKKVQVSWSMELQ